MNFEHVTKAVDLGWKRPYFAYFCDPGTGKTRITLLDAKKNFDAKKIDALLVIAKNSGKTNWVIWDHMIEDPKTDEDQVSKVLGPDVIKGVWISGATGKDKQCWRDFEKKIDQPEGRLIILSINYEALLSNQFFEFLCEFCRTRQVMIAADESTRIGEPGSKRTKQAIKLAKLCVKRRLLSGTPITKTPMKIYSQAKFLGDGAIGYTSFYSFRARYAKMGGFGGREIVGYRNMDELSRKIESFSFRVLAEECLDLPEKTFVKRRVYLTPEQTKAYNEMRKEFFTEVGADQITATIVLTQMTRLQQILGGYGTTQDGKVVEIITPERNPKITEAIEIIEDAPGQCIVWCRFKSEIDAMVFLLKKKKISFYEFHGGITDTEERVRIRKAFQRGERQVIVATASTGGDSIDEFKVATTVIFVSNDFDTEKRVQAERRNWRAGMDTSKPVTYYDILVPNTVDTKILGVLRGDAQMSAKVLKESWREWI